MAQKAGTNKQRYKNDDYGYYWNYITADAILLPDLLQH